MKLLSPEKMIGLGTLTDAGIVAAASKRIVLASPFHGFDPECLHDEWKRGEVKASTIQVNGDNAYIIFWKIATGGLFVISGATYLLQGSGNFEDLVAGCEALAKQNSCTKIIFHSIREGIAALVLKAGARPVAVCYMKDLSQPVPTATNGDAGSLRAYDKGRHD